MLQFSPDGLFVPSRRQPGVSEKTSVAMNHSEVLPLGAFYLQHKDAPVSE